MSYTNIRLSTPSTKKYRVVKIYVDGGGHCFFHAFCMAFYTVYRTGILNGKPISKLEIVKTFRKEVSEILSSVDPDDPQGRIRYETILNGILPGFAVGDFEAVFSLDGINKILLSDSSVGEEIVSICSAIVGKAVYILVPDSSGSYNTYSQGGIPNGTESIVISWDKQGHYELIGIINNRGSIVTHFDNNHGFIRALREELKMKKC